MKKFFKVFLIVLLVLLLFVSAAAAIVYSKINKLGFSDSASTGNTDPEEECLATEEMRSDLVFELPSEDTVTDRSVINILLLGTDVKINGTTDPGRADCTMLCSINKGTGEVRLISFERGIYVPIPANSNPYGATSDLLTHAYHWGGADLSCSIISECFNVSLDGYAQVDLSSFIDIIDLVGGIDVELSEAEAYGINTGHYAGYVETPHEAGLNHLNGHEAASFARLRKIDSDWQRTGRQRRVIMAVLDKVKTMNIAQLNSLADSILPMIHTNLTKTEIASILLAAPKILSNLTIEQLMVPDENMNEYSYIDCNFEYESLKIANFIYGTNYTLPDSGYSKK